MRISKLLFVIIVLFFGAYSEICADELNIEQPVKKTVGDTCSYRTVDGWTGIEENQFTWKFVGISEKGYEVSELLVKTGKVSVVMMTLDFNIKEIVGGTKYEINSGYYSFPLFTGKSWKTKTGFIGRSLHGTFLIVGEVVGEESVTVPAGTFSTMKIEVKSYADVMLEESRREWTEIRTVWYIPKLGCFAKRTLDIMGGNGRIFRKVSTELQGYTVN